MHRNEISGDVEFEYSVTSTRFELKFSAYSYCYCLRKYLSPFLIEEM